MSNATHETAPTEFVQVGGVRFAYRRFGRPGDLPLLLARAHDQHIGIRHGHHTAPVVRKGTLPPVRVTVIM